MGFLDSLYNSTIGAVLGMGTTALDSLGLSQHGRDQYFTRDMQREFLNTQIAAQSAENQKNRDFSMQMYEKQMADYLKNYPELLRMQSDAEFNLWKSQFDQQNEYNDIRNQVQRMMSAGLSPSGGTQTVATNNMSHSSVSPPPVLHGSPLGGSISPIGLPQGMGSNGQTLRDVGGFIRDIAEAKNKGADTVIKEVEGELAARTLEERVRAVGLKNNWTEEQINLAKQQYDEILGRVNLMQKEGLLKDKELATFDAKMTAEINDLKSSKQYKDALSKYNDKERELLEAMFDDLKNYQMYSTQQIQKFVDLLDKYGDAQAIIGMLTQVVDSAVNVVGLFKPKVSEIIHTKK